MYDYAPVGSIAPITVMPNRLDILI